MNMNMLTMKGRAVIELLWLSLLSRPHRVTVAGRTLYGFAALQVAAGVFAQVVTSAVRRLDPDRDVRWLADVWPGVSTWWIPETVVGLLGVFALATAGLVVAYNGRRFDRLMS